MENIAKIDNQSFNYNKIAFYLLLLANILMIILITYILINVKTLKGMEACELCQNRTNKICDYPILYSGTYNIIDKRNLTYPNLSPFK